VRTIGDCVFLGCESLDTIICQAKIPPVIYNDTFEDMFTTPRIIVPCGTLSAYRKSDWGKRFTNIIEDCKDKKEREYTLHYCK